MAEEAQSTTPVKEAQETDVTDGKEAELAAAANALSPKVEEGQQKAEGRSSKGSVRPPSAASDAKDDSSSSVGFTESDYGSRPPSAGEASGMGKGRPRSGKRRSRRRKSGSPQRSDSGLSNASGGSGGKSNAARRATIKARRSSVSKIRTSTRTSRLLDGGTDEKPVMAGLLLDFVERLAKDKGKDGLLKDALHDPKTYEFLNETFEREGLVSQFMDGIITYNKSTENLGAKEKPWPKTSAAAMRAQIKQIVDTKKQASCLYAEVHNWLLKYKLFHSYVKGQLETAEERRNRLEEFWDHYHTRCKRNELPPIAVEAFDNMEGPNARPMSPSNNLLNKTRREQLLERNKSAAALAKTTSFALPPELEDPDETIERSDGLRGKRITKSKSNFSLSAEEQWSMIDSIEAKEEDFSSPSRRMAKSKSSCSIGSPTKYGMRWNQDGTAMKWSPVDPAPGSRAAIANNLFQAKNLQVRSRQSGFGSALASNREKDKKGKKGEERLPPLEAAGMMGRGSSSPAQQTVLSTDKYLEACQRCWIVPMPLPFVTGHSFRLLARGRDMKDTDLRAITVMIQSAFSLVEIDLGGNTKLTEKALVPFIHRLFGEPCCTTLQRLVLSECRNIGLGTMNMTIRLLSDLGGARALRTLELSRVRITPKCQLDLAKAIHHHPCLEELHLQDTALGATVLAKQCLEELLACKTMHYLDLSWNCFDPDEFLCLGRCLVEGSRNIKTLKLSNCSSASVGLSNPVTYFLEQLSHDESLTNLDVSINRMDFRSALIIEDALSDHRKIQELNISDNPFGVMGMRSALRLLSRATSGLQHFECRGCFNGRVFAEDPKVPAQVFNMSNPGGRYTLNLEMPYHRSLLRMLYKTSEQFNVLHEQSFENLRYSKGPWVHATKDYRGIWEVPQTGKLVVTYNIEKALEQKLKDVPDDNFAEFLERHAELMKWTPTFNKAIPLFAQFKLMEGQTTDMFGFIEAVSKDFRLPPSFLQQMFHSCSSLRNTILMALLPGVAGGAASRTVSMWLIPTIGEAIKMVETMQTLLDFFNAENPTGHYKLTLDSASDYAVAQQLILLDRWEVVIGKRKNRVDTSQHGNNSHLRNETYQGRALRLEYSSVSEWNMPETDIFEFDYTSAKRPPTDARVLGEEPYTNMLINIAESTCKPEGKVQAIRQVSHHFFLTALQMREMLGAFKEESMRAEAFIALYLRVVDVYNAKVFVVRFADRAELKRLQDRLGYVTFFPFIQPENAVFDLDFSFNDQRLCANMILVLSGKEGTQNIREPVYIREDGTVDPLPLGVPRSWERLDQCPKAGIFKATYMCAPENRKFALRSQLAETLGYFNMDTEEEHVMWWTGLTEPPEDVLDFLEWLIGRYDDVMRAFKDIDGEDGNGVITLREFEEGLKELDCQKYKGKDEQQRIAALFRYLDPGGEGSVSEEEWGVLNQLWKEFDLSIKEFVHYLQRQFGDDLHDAWAFLDNDDSGELTLDEWIAAVESIGFFGPAKPVFGLLDNSDDGSISVDEFAVLEKYKKKPKGEASAADL